MIVWLLSVEFWGGVYLVPAFASWPPLKLIMDQRTNRDDDQDDQRIHVPPYPSGSTPIPPPPTTGTLSGYTLMVAGKRTGKTSFLRLLLDTSDISHTATKDQLASVAKFVQGSSGHTSHIRTASFDIQLDPQATGVFQHLTLSLVDTPSLDFPDDSSSERLVSELLRHIDSRFAEGIEDVRTFSPLFPISPHHSFPHRTGKHRMAATTYICLFFFLLFHISSSIGRSRENPF